MVQVLDKPQKVKSSPSQAKTTAEKRLQYLIEQHRGKLASSFNELIGSGNGRDETADDIIKAVRDWRDQTKIKSFFEQK